MLTLSKERKGDKVSHKYVTHNLLLNLSYLMVHDKPLS